MSINARQVFDPNHRSDADYPWNDPELAILASFLGEAGLEENNRVQASLATNRWQNNSFLGHATAYHKDLRVKRINNQFGIVFWGGEGVEAAGLWSFQVCRARPDGKTDPQFDESLDRPVDLVKEHLRVLVDSGVEWVSPYECRQKYTVLQDGGMGAMEGGTIYIEHTPDDAPPAWVPFTFPVSRGNERREAKENEYVKRRRRTSESSKQHFHAPL
ncbi:hypothetical protein C8R44DRAFT_811393 [Mycena epipterygia]|nr:hypothetical protein C8R44DRAFT_811393 [Mycena epipterygia]